MANGTIEFAKSSASGSYLEGKIVWSAKSDSDANASKDVSAKLYVRKGNPDVDLTIATTGTWTYQLNLGGDSISGSANKSVLTDWVLIATKQADSIKHNADGTKTVQISGSVSAPAGTSFSGQTTSGTGEAVLDPIPRASTIVSAESVTLGNACSVKWVPAAKSFRYKLKFMLENWKHTTDAIHPNKTTEYTYSGYQIPLSAAKGFPDKTSAEMKVLLYTYSDASAETQVGTSTSSTFRVKLPKNDDTKPSVDMTLEPVNSLDTPFDTLYLQSKSRVRASIQATGKYGASITAYQLTVDGETYESSGQDTPGVLTSGVLTAEKQVTVRASATDSRGYTNSVSQKISVIPYHKPWIMAATGETHVIAARCDADGTYSDGGTYLRIRASRSYSPVKTEDGQQNYCYIRYRYKPENASAYSDWVRILKRKELDSNEVDTGPLLDGALRADSAYTVQVGVKDDLGHYNTKTIHIPTDAVFLHKAGSLQSIGIGKYVDESQLLDVAWNARFHRELRLGADGAPLATYVTRQGWYLAAGKGCVTENDGGDFISNCWYFREWDDGRFDAFGRFDLNVTGSTATATGGAYYSDLLHIALPFEPELVCISGTASAYCWIANGTKSDTLKNGIAFRLMRGNTIPDSVTVRLSIQGILETT